MSQSIYQRNGFNSRSEYIQSLKDMYDSELVDSLLEVLPPSEDFDGLVTELNDYSQTIYNIWKGE